MTKTAKIGGIDIAVCGLHELPDWVNSEVTHVISILGGQGVMEHVLSSKIKSLFPQARVLPCYFNDVTEAGATFPPTLETIQSVLEFTGALNPGNRLLVHCAAGISRSTAMAFAVLCQHWGPGYELEAYAELKAIRPCASPNPFVVQLADSILKRDGRMVEAIR